MGGRGGQGAGPVLANKGELYSRERSHKWSQTCKSNSGLAGAHFFKNQKLRRGITPLILCWLTPRSDPIFKLASKPAEATSLFGTKQPHLQEEKGGEGTGGVGREDQQPPGLSAAPRRSALRLFPGGALGFFHGRSFTHFSLSNSPLWLLKTHS